MGYYSTYAESLGVNLKSVQTILKFTKNSDVIGEYAEKVVKNFIKEMVSPLRIVSGMVISPAVYENDEEEGRQIDLMLWDPNPLPPIFHLDDFGLVPRNSVFGILEIKRTDYDAGLDDIEDRFDNRLNILPDWQNQEHRRINENNFLGIICVLEKRPDGDNKYTRLSHKLTNSLIHLIEKRDGVYTINEAGVFRLINFIANCVKIQLQNPKSHTVEIVRND